MQLLENEYLKILVNPKGAELNSMIDKTTDTEYMWNGDPAFWSKHSPVLFPIVGTLKNDTYKYNGHWYKLSRHGFARDMVFDLVEKKSNNIRFSIQSNKETLEKFPFEFELQINYSLIEKTLQVNYLVKNKTNSSMYFSIGGHPAFALPIDNHTNYEDYALVFEKEEKAGRWPISKEGLIELEPVPFLNGNNLPLSKKLFEKDALVFKHLKSSYVKLQSKKTGKGFRFDFKDFTYLGIWAAKNANFICIEPWCGIADSVDSDQDFTLKEGIICLPKDEIFSRSWSVSLV